MSSATPVTEPPQPAPPQTRSATQAISQSIALVIVGVGIGATVAWALFLGDIRSIAPLVDSGLRIGLLIAGALVLLIAVLFPIAIWAVRRLARSTAGTFSGIVASVGDATRSAIDGDGKGAATNVEAAVLGFAAWYTPIALRQWIATTTIALLIALGGLAGTALLFRQTLLLDDQNKKLEKQTNLLETQNKTIELQNESMIFQVVTSESQRRSNLLIELYAIMASIGELADRSAIIRVPRPLEGRIVAFSESAQAYLTVEVDTYIDPQQNNDETKIKIKPSPRAFSPERRQLVIGLIASGIDTSHMKLNLSSTNLQESYIDHCIIRSSNISDSLFYRTSATNCDFTSSDLTNSSIRETSFDSSNFSYVDFNGSEFTLTTMNESNFTSAKFYNATLKIIQANDCRFDHATFVGSNLDDSDFSRSVFKDTHFEDTSLKDTDFSNADLRFSIFKNSSLSNANLEGAIVGANQDSDQLPAGFPAGWDGPPLGWELARDDQFTRLRRAPSHRQELGKRAQ